MKAGLFTCSAALKTDKGFMLPQFYFKEQYLWNAGNWETKVGQGNIKENKNRHNFIQ